jgi:hypothetical protein
MFTPNESIKYRILSMGSGQGLDVNQGRVERGNQTIQWPWGGRAWTFRIENGLYLIQPSTNEGLRLGVGSGSTGPDAEIILWKTLEPDQYWRLVSDLSGCSFSLVNNQSGLLMSVQNGNTDPTRQAAKIVQLPDRGWLSQKWMATQV